MQQKSVNLLIALTFFGMVGIYVGAYIAWKKYQGYQGQLDQAGGVVGLLAGLFKK